MNDSTKNIRYVAGGTVQADGGIYVERSADAKLLRLCRGGVFTYVLTSRQMGKSSLMVRTADKLRETGVHSVIIDLTAIGVMVTPAQWYRGILVNISDQLKLQTCFADWWEKHEHLSVAQRFSQFLTDVVTRETAGRIVIFVDEIDSTLPLDFTDDFFAVIRYLYNARAEDPKLSDLSFVLLGAASPSDLIHNVDVTPFNIGQPVDLQPFTEEEAAVLHPNLELVRSVLRYTGGHPYLTLRVFQSLAEDSSPADVKFRVESLFFGDQAHGDRNLQFVRDKLSVRDKLTVRAPSEIAVLNLYQQVLRGKKDVPDKESDPICVWLRLSGVVRSEAGVLRVANLIYKTVFDEAWVRRHKKVDWARRAKQFAAAAAVLLVVLVIAGIVVWNEQQRKIAEGKARYAEIAAEKQREFLEAKNRLTQEENERIAAQAKQLARSERAERLSEQAAKRSEQAAKRSEQLARRSEQAERIARGEAEKQRKLSDQAAAKAGKAEADAEKSAEETTVQSLVSQSLLLQKTHPDQVRVAMLLAIESFKRSQSAEQKAQAIDALSPLNNLLLLSRTAVLSQGIVTNGVAFSPGGRFASIANGDGTAIVFEGGKWRQKARFPLGQNVETVAVSPDGRQLATGGDDGMARVFDIASGRELAHLGHKQRVLSVAFSFDGRLATGSEDRTARILEIASGRVAVLAHASAVRTVAFSPNGQLLATGSDDGELRVFEAGIGKFRSDVGRQLVRIPHGYPINSVAFSGDGSLLATAGHDRDNAVRVFDTYWSEVARLPHGQPVRSISFGARDRLLATGNEDGMARIFDTITWQEVARILHESPVRSVALSNDGRWLITSDNKTAQVFEVRPERENVGRALPFDRNGNLISAYTFENTTHILDGAPGREDLCMHCPTWLHSVAFSRDKHLIAVGEDKGVRVFDVESRQQKAHFADKSVVRSVAFSPDGHFLAIGTDSNTAIVTEAGTFREVATFVHDGPVRTVAFSPDGNLLATGSEDKSARIFNLKSKLEVVRFPHLSSVISVAFSQDGQLLATASDGQAPQLFDVSTRRERSSLQTLAAHYVSFSPNTRDLGTAASDNSVRIIDIESGKELTRLPHAESVRSLAFKGDDQIAAVGYSFVDIGHWGAEDIIKDACARVSYNMSRTEWKTYHPKREDYKPTCKGLPEPPDAPRLAAVER